MSTNRKLRTLAGILPPYPRMKEGKPLFTGIVVSGKVYKEKNPGETHLEGKLINDKKNYRMPVVLFVNHFEQLRKAFDKDGEKGVQQYCQMVHEYDSNRKEQKVIKRPIFLMGPASSGKTKRAQDISEGFPKDAIEWIPCRKRKNTKAMNEFWLSQITEKTQLIIFDDVVDLKLLARDYNPLKGEISVSRKGQAPLIVKPYVLVTCDESIVPEQVQELWPYACHMIDIIELPAREAVQSNLSVVN